MSQNSYNIDQPEAFAGLKADSEFDKVESYALESLEMRFGIFAAVGTDPVQQVKIPAAGDTIRGIAIHQHVEKELVTGKAVYTQTMTVGVLRQGVVWMRVATGASLAVDGPVYANIDVASEEGFAVELAGTDNILIPTGVVRKLGTDPDGNAIAAVEINLP